MEDFLNVFGRQRATALERGVSTAIHELITMSAHTIRPEELKRRAAKHGVRIEDVSDLRRCDLRLLDRCNRDNIDVHALTSTAQGALLGLAGAILAPADLAVVLGTTFHLMQETSSCHGFDPDDPIEKEIMLHLLEIGVGAPDHKKRALAAIDDLLARARAGEETGVLLEGDRLNLFASKALAEYLQHLTIALGCRLLAHCLPVVSVITGAKSNHEFVSDCGEAAFMVYRKMFLMRKRWL
jgi:hypothetical protein